MPQRQRHGPIPKPRIRATNTLRTAVDESGPRWAIAIRVGIIHGQLLSQLVHGEVPATPANREKYIRIAAVVGVNSEDAYESVREAVTA